MTPLDRTLRRSMLAIALTACAVLLFEIALTRILSVVLWYHWAFLSVSLAMVGLGAPGVWFSFRPAGPRLRNGVLTVSSDESRSQWRNRQLARRQLAEMVAEGLRPAPPPRRSTKPSRAAKRRRLESKRARSRIKQLRRRPDVD